MTVSKASASITRSREIVREFIVEKLYPVDTPEFEAKVISSWAEDGVWRIFIVTDLPDDTVYEVRWTDKFNPVHEVVVYKQIEID